jgi:hypothetical protein
MKTFLIKWLIGKVLELIVDVVNKKAKDTESTIDDSFAKCLEENKDEIAKAIKEKV